MFVYEYVDSSKACMWVQDASAIDQKFPPQVNSSALGHTRSEGPASQKQAVPMPPASAKHAECLSVSKIASEETLQI